MKTHKDLEVWKNAIDFVTTLYKITHEFPTIELYGLSSQLRRAAISIPSNIAEGYSRKGNKETIHFLYNALASNTEIETQLIIAKNLGYINDSTFNKLEQDCTKTGKQLVKLIRYLQSK